MARLTILVDMDGPVADFETHFWNRCVENGWELDCAQHEQTERYGTSHVVNPAHRRLARAMVETAGWYAELPPVAGALDGLVGLAVHADVWLCTKPLEDNPTCRDDKGAWVRRCLGGDWERRLIISPDKSMIRGDFLLDDAPKPAWYPFASWAPVIYTAPYNGKASEWGRVPHWDWTSPHPLHELDWDLERALLAGERPFSG